MDEKSLISKSDCNHKGSETHHHYRLFLSNRKITMLEVKVNNKFVKAESFQKPITTNKLPKIYIIKNGDKIIYVGIASQSIINRLRYGFAAKGKGGYHGYRWKDLKERLDLLIWCFSGESLNYIESIEAEIVFAIRHETGQWPSYQTEIHFHNVTNEEKELAQRIYKQAKAVNEH
jgi:hypothetical protein